MIKLGNKVRDKVSGLEGIATGRCEYLNGCVQILVRPQVVKDGVPAAGTWIDVGQLEDQGVGVTIEARPTGGPMPDAPADTYRG